MNQEKPMSVISAQQVRDASKSKANESNLASVLMVLDKYGRTGSPSTSRS